MLEVNALCCVRGEREIIRNLSFAVGDGQWAHVRGENGAGKTTLLKALTGLLRPASGTVTWNNQPIDKEREDYHRSLAYLGHSNALKDDMDAEENLQIACAIAGAPPVRPVAEALRLLGLNPANRSPMRALSQEIGRAHV